MCSSYEENVSRDTPPRGAFSWHDFGGTYADFFICGTRGCLAHMQRKGPEVEHLVLFYDASFLFRLLLSIVLDAISQNQNTTETNATVPKYRELNTITGEIMQAYSSMG
jgi:hypothetical protein